VAAAYNHDFLVFKSIGIAIVCRIQLHASVSLLIGIVGEVRIFGRSRSTDHGFGVESSLIGFKLKKIIFLGDLNDFGVSLHRELITGFVGFEIGDKFIPKRVFVLGVWHLPPGQGTVIGG